MSVITNAKQIAARYRRRMQRLNGAVARGLRKAAVAIDREQAANLSGGASDAPGSYPVPVRTGTLRRASGWALHDDKAASVFNTAAYAAVIHDDRPFLDDAVEAVDYVGMVADEVSRAMVVN